MNNLNIQDLLDAGWYYSSSGFISYKKPLDDSSYILLTICDNYLMFQFHISWYDELITLGSVRFELSYFPDYECFVYVCNDLYKQALASMFMVNVL